MKLQYHLFFSGLVQGVGFRFTTRDLAKKYNIKGWVKNLPDGRVEAVAEASRINLKYFLEGLKNEFKNNILDFEKYENSYTDKYKDFQITF